MEPVGFQGGAITWIYPTRRNKTGSHDVPRTKQMLVRNEHQAFVGIYATIRATS